VECAQSLFSVLKGTVWEEVELNRTTDARELAASAAGKSWWTKYLRERTAVRVEQADYRFHEPAAGFGQSQAASRSAAAGSMEAELATGYEPFLFLVGQVRPSLLEKLNQKSPTCHYPILKARKM
jgi:hypothetical protein